MIEKGRDIYSPFGLRTYSLSIPEVWLLPAGEGMVVFYYSGSSFPVVLFLVVVITYYLLSKIIEWKMPQSISNFQTGAILSSVVECQCIPIGR